MTANSSCRVLCPALAALALATGSLAWAQETYVGEFELEGDMLDQPTTIPPDLSGVGTDWSAIFLVAPGSKVLPVNANPLPENVKVASFIRDFNIGSSTDGTTFTTGSKDVQNISGGGQTKGNWQCTDSNNVSDKGDIIDAYAAIQMDVDDEVEAKLVFGIERFSQHGSAKIGLWFLQDDSVGCPGTSGTRDFVGNHVDGDLLIVAAFDKGGNLTVIQAFQWVGGANGYLNPTPIATGQDCKTTGDPDLFCATTNATALSWKANGTGTVPWYIETKTTTGSGTSVENVLPATTFVEGVLNLTHYQAQRCFTTFLANTRQSTSLTSTIFDFAMGSFNACTVGLTKACTAPPSITADGKAFTYPFEVTVTNTGAGAVYGLELQEQAVAHTTDGDWCKLENGTSLYGSTANPNDNPWVPIVSSLDAGHSATLQFTCRDKVNGFANSVRVHAKSSSNGTQWDVGATYTMSTADTDACKATINSDLSVVKECLAPNGVTLVSSGGALAVEVKVVVGLTNGSDEALDQVTFGDDKVPAASFQQVCDLQGKPLSECSGSYSPFQGTLGPGESVYFLGSYRPTAVSTGNTNCPSGVVFTDTASADGVGFISGTPVHGSDSANCALCEPCQ